MENNFTSNIIKQQLATRSGQIGIVNKNGQYTYVDVNTGKSIPGRNITTNLLANPQRPNDPKIQSQALDLATGYYTDPLIPSEFVEGIASVAAYLSVTTGMPIQNMFSNNTISLQLISAYNAFQPKGSQVGVFVGSGNPAWTNNPVLRGTIANAFVNQP